MNNGGGERGRRSGHLHSKRKYDRTDFAHAIAKIAVAQMCESAGFHSFQQRALEKLSEVALHYIHDIGKNVSCYANLAGRTEANVFDVIQGLEDLNSGLGFAGACDISHSLSSSDTVKDIISYVREAEDIPFAYSIPSLSVAKVQKPTPSFLHMGEEPPEEHIPAWLPAFPDEHTYINSERENDRATVSECDKIEQAARQQRKAEQSLLNLQHIFGSGWLEGPSMVDSKDDAKAKQAAESNPFLAAPLHLGENEVSSSPPPAKPVSETFIKSPAAEDQPVNNHIPVLETFAPAIDAVRRNLCDTEQMEKQEPFNKRPLVQFKIGITKKSFGTSLDFRSDNKNIQKVVPLIGNDDEKNEKKRRAEKILNESMENTQKLAQ